MALQFGNAKPKLMYGNSKVKLMCGSTKLYSSGSAVSYYDGATLIGTLDVDEGLDVLHPDLPLNKDGYTLVGWQYNEERVATLAANGDNMALYAVYLPNTLVVYQEGSIHDANYTSGSYRATATGNWNSASDTANFNVNFKDYQNGAINCYFTMGGVGFGAYYVNGVQNIVYSGTTSIPNIDGIIHNGANSIGADAYAGSGTLGVSMTVRRITLSNPRAWT